jgi:conjugative relaxase-like TrwC/TraI family protein
MSDPLSAGQTETYFDEHYSKDDYYTQGQICVGQWVGKGAADLGLAGDVTREDFSALLQGINPRSGAVFIPAATHNHEHRAGWDSVFSAPKTVSVQALAGGDARLIQAHIRAAQRALVEAEAYAMARQHGGQEYVTAANVLGAAFNHLAARPADDVRLPDPQLHTHVVLLNMTRRPDGQWRSMDPINIYGAQRFGTAVYRSELAREVQKLGYEIQVTDADGKWELKGYTRAQVMIFSQRRQQIEQDMIAKGYSGPKAAQLVALGTRQAKGDYTEAELKADWQQRTIEAGIDAKQHLFVALGRGDMNRGNAADAYQALEFAYRHSTEREAVVDIRDLQAAALEHGMGRVDLDALRKEIAAAEHRRTLVRANNVDWHHPQGAFTTDKMLRLESENVSFVREGIGKANPLGAHESVQFWAEAKGLSDEQINAAQIQLTSDDWITSIEGLAGAAKTTTVGAIKEFAEDKGYTVRGFGMTSKAASELRKVGVAARTVASLIGNPLPERQGPELWFADESSLIDSRNCHALLNAARNQGVDRIVFVGDQKQHQSIKAGAPVRQFLADNMKVAYLREIRRQEDPELRRAVQLAESRAPEALDLLLEQGRVTEIPDAKERYRRIADDYLKGHERGRQTLVISPGNDERRALNQEIRQALVEHGHVAKHGREHEILIARDFTDEQIRYARSYNERDVIHFDRAHRKQGIAKDSYLTVEAVDRDGNLLTLRTADGRQLEVSPARWQSAQVYQSEHRQIAAGDRIQFRIHDKKYNVPNNEFATIEMLNRNKAHLHLDDGRDLTIPLSQLRHIDLGYCSTSHTSQGGTADYVIINADSMRSRLVNREQFYVSGSRVKKDLHIYTNDVEALRLAVGRERKKEIALNAVKQQPTQELDQTQKQAQSIGMRI